MSAWYVREDILPLEEDEQITVCDWLDANGVKYFAVPNGGHRSKRTAGRLKRAGARAGVPDLIIVDPPNPIRNYKTWDGTGHYTYTVNALGTKVVALEMKRQKGGKVSPEQREWLAELSKRGWVCLLANGAGDAIEQLTALGYARRTK